MMAGMRLLDRYLLRELLLPLAYCLGGFLVFYVAFDLIFHIRTFQETHLGLLAVAEYYLVTLPELLVQQVIPVSLLLALLYELTNLSRHNELTAMRAAGVSLWRLSLPFLAVGIILGLVVLAMNELLVPHSQEEAKDILHSQDGLAQSRVWVPKLSFYNEADGRHWEMTRYNRLTHEMILPVVHWDQSKISHLDIYADRGIYRDGRWVFTNVEEWSSQTLHTNYALLSFNFSETPAWINSEIKVASMSPTQAAKRPQLSIREILDYLPPPSAPEPGAVRQVDDPVPVPRRPALHLSGRGPDRAAFWGARQAAQCLRRRGQQRFHLLHLFYHAALRHGPGRGRVLAALPGRLAAQSGLWPDRVGPPLAGR